MAETELAVVMSRHSSNGGANKHYLSNAQAQLSPSSSVALTTDSSKTLDAGCTTKANPHGTTGLGHTPGIDPDYIMQLVNDVRNFTDVLLTLKEALQLEEPQEGLQRVVQERLAELLRVLRVVCGKHQTLNSADVLSAAGTVIAKVKGVNFKEVNKKSRDAVFDEIYASIDTLAFTFGNVVSDFLMGDVDSSSRLGHPQARRCRSFENLPGDCGGCDPEKDDPAEPASPSAPLPVAEQVDQALLRNESGVESALLYAKAWSKYTKDLLAWVEKRLALDIECAKSFAKMAESAKAVTSQQDYMPFRDIYVAAFKNEIEYSQSLLQTSLALQANKFIQPLLVRKNELDKLRKDIKEQWQREQKKMEAESAVRKAKQLQAQRKEEHERARTSTCRTEEEQPAAGGRTLEKKRRLEEDALLKAEEAQDHYRACLADAAHKRMGLANAKSEILTRIRGLVYQCDLTLKAVTVNWFQMQQAQAATLPLSYQALGERAKRYEPGQRYAQFVQHLPKERVWLEALSKEGAGLPFNKRSLGSSRSSHGNLSQASGDGHSADEVVGPGDTRTGRIEERRCNSSADIQALRTQSSQPSWGVASQGGGMCSDSESAGGSSESRSMDSPTASPGDFKRRLPRTPSTGTMSSADDLDEREPPSPSDNGLGEMVTETASSPGPFRNAQMSKAAHTHKLRKLRAPSKCRECDSLVVFHGAECEECSLACHKKCLETLAIQCGHKKLLGRLHLFGIDFVQAAKDSSDGIPFIIKKCTSEIESRALNIKGIYRVNGAKSRVEKLCQAFENGKDLVELSDLSPHDISNVLKLYLRQLPEPLILYRYYNEFIGLAKEAQAIMVDEVESAQGRFPGEQPCLSIELNRVVFRIRDLLRQLPATHYKTLQFLIAHLNRVTEKVDENKMTASNLGIIFGPTLIKPRQSEAEVSLSSLVDYPYQALMVELLIRHQQMMFDMPLSPVSPTSPTAAQGPLAGPHRDREPRLSRHSQSLMDIKEQSSKVYKRQSSLMPSSHSLDEAQELLAEDRQSTLAGEGAGRLNGVDASASSGVQRSTLACGRPMSVSGGGGPVQLRTQASSRPLCRPISMPVDRLLSERNSRNAAERERSPAAIQETTEPERERTQTRPCSTYYRTPVIDTQTLRRTWDRQYKHYDVTPRTAMIVANLPSSGVTDKARSPVAKEMASPTCSVSNKFPNSPYMGTVGSGRASRRDSSSSSEKAGVPITFRAPRTLQPPPETFYKPPTKSRARPPHQDRTITTTVTTTATTVTAALDTTASTSSATATVATATAPTATASATSGAVESSEGDGHLGAAEGSDGEAADPGAASSAPRSPDSCSGSERPSPTEAKPLYQRLRSHRLHELERREAHFV